MSPELIKLLTYLVVTMLIGLPFALVLVRIIFKKSILTKIPSLMLIAAYLLSICGAMVIYFDEIHQIWIAPLGSAILIISIILMKRLTVRPIQNLQSKITEISKGNLNVSIEVDIEELKSNNEISQINIALSEMTKNLKEIVSEIKKASTSINNSGRDLNAGSLQMSQLASEQAASAEEVSASMEQMTASIRQNADNAVKAGKLAKKSAVKTEVSNKNVQKSTEALAQIVKKIDIINDIAFQTDILSLNASIEASKAGSHGKGFNVVAREIRKLADKSKTAALEIEKLSVSSMNIADRTGRISKQTVPDIKKTATLVLEISEGSLEQDAGATQVNNAIQELNSATQKFAAVSEELSVNSEELVQLGIFLNSKMAFFKV